MTPKYRLAPNRRGLFCRIVEDVEIPMQVEKVAAMGHHVSNTRPAIIARFCNEQLAREFLEAWKTVHLKEEGK